MTYDVSVIIPTYNRADYLPAAIESVLGQKGDHGELVVVDDGSTDGTADVVARYAGRIRYVRQENRGCAAARNLGVKVTASRYLVFLDSDDLIAPCKLSVQSALLAANPEIGFVYSDSIEFRVDHGKIRYYVLPAVARNAPETFAVKHFLRLGVRPGSLMLRRDAFEAIGGFDEGMRYNEDSDLIQRLSIRYRAVFSGYPAILQRHHGSNKSSNRLQIYRALLASMEKTLAQNPEFLESVGEKAAASRIEKITNVLIGLEQQNVTEATTGLINEGLAYMSHLGGRFHRKLRTLLLMREQRLLSKHIIEDLESLII